MSGNGESRLDALAGIPDWQDPENYPDPKEATLQDWAWEFIRRNPDYRQDWSRFQEIVRNNPSIEKEIESYKKHTSDLLEQHTVRKKSKGEKGGDMQVYSFPPLSSNTDKNRREKQEQVNNEFWNFLNKWPFHVNLPDPQLNWREIDTLNGVWWRQIYTPEIILPGVEVRPHYYGISKPDRFAVIFSLEYLWEPQAKHIKDNAMDISKAFRHGLLYGKEDVSLESPCIDYESRHTELPDSSVFHLGTVEAPSVGYSFKWESAFVSKLSMQLKDAEQSFKQLSKKYKKTAVRNTAKKYRLYLRLLDARSQGVGPGKYGPILYNSWSASSVDTGSQSKVAKDLIAAYAMQNSRAILLIQ